jgi:hypothetical protein
VSAACLAGAACIASVAAVAPAAAAGTVAWAIRGVAEPSAFSAGDRVACEAGEGRRGCDRYQLLVRNAGEEASTGTVTVTDTLPLGIAPLGSPRSGQFGGDGAQWSCMDGVGVELRSTVTCELAEAVPAGANAPGLDILVTAPTESMSGVLWNELSVGGGGAPALAEASEQTPIGSPRPQFGLSEFGFEVGSDAGGASLQAGAHPWELTTSFGVATVLGSAAEDGATGLRPLGDIKSLAVELPAGLLGDAQAAPKCSETELAASTCPTASEIGAFAVAAGQFAYGEFKYGPAEAGCCSAVYDVTPAPGYPAEFGFTYGGVPTAMYASLVRSGGRYRVRLAIPYLPTSIEIFSVQLTFFGEPGALNGSGSDASLLTNPTACTALGLTTRITLTSWGEPHDPRFGEATAYPSLTGCNLLQYAPSLSLAPGTTAEGGTSEADAPSAYTAAIEQPQTQAFSEDATPELEDATVTLPEGVSIDPAAADGLEGCREQGPEGINIGSDQIGPEGRDEGDPEATELGEGHGGPGGNGSPYDDGLDHTAPGHCPVASTLGTVEIYTPLLSARCGAAGQAPCGPGESPASLQGRVFLAAPSCGGAGQPACSEASALDGQLFGLYLEASGSGMIVKLAGTISASPTTGRLAVSFREMPQLPLSELELHFRGGPRALLANPQACGSFAASSVLSSWAGQEVSETAPAFSVDWDGSGGACPASAPFAPLFAAGTLTATAGGSSPFTLAVSRQDREQDLSTLSFTTPPGLLANLSSVAACPEPQAARGACSAAAELGTATVAAGAASSPLQLSGHVYLTGPYNGRPYGLSIPIAAEIGPFHLGTVIVRASIAIDPTTLALTIATDPLPQIVDGIPLRIRTLDVTLDRPGFILNPTNCSEQQVTGTLGAAQGATANVASPFAVSGCTQLPFSPKLTALTRANGEFAGHGASLHLTIATTAGQANLRALKIDLPQRLPARLQTIQHACPQAVFNRNPAACPAASAIGSATVATPISSSPLTGPAYLVSHGGAAFPDMVLVLQAQGVRVDLTGALYVDAHNITSTTFRTLPDVPIRRLDLVLPEGKRSALAASSGLCTKKPLIMLTAITAQDNARVKPTVKVAVEGCKRPKRAKPKRSRRR